jgi:hypothetical protein
MQEFDRPVGYHWDGSAGRWMLTRQMVVVLSPDRKGVVTAYPVGRF